MVVIGAIWYAAVKLVNSAVFFFGFVYVDGTGRVFSDCFACEDWGEGGGFLEGAVGVVVESVGSQGVLSERERMAAL